MTRAWLARTTVGLALAVLLAPVLRRPRAPMLVLVGTQGGGPGEGIHAAVLDTRTGRLTRLGLAAQAERPTWLLLNGRRLYASSEIGNAGDRDGAVLGFALQRRGWTPRLLGSQSSGGGGATHLALDRRNTLFVANFGGQAASLPLHPNGAPGPVASLQATSGSGPHRRQAGPHPHGVTLDPGRRFLLVPDMGADRVFVYRYDPATRLLTPAETAFLQMPAGSGPRLLLFGRDGRFAYLLSELSAELFVLHWDAASGRLMEVGRVGLDPQEASHSRSAAALILSRNGRRLYVSNRGTHQIQCYTIDRRSGALREMQRIDAGGARPWATVLSPDGRWLLVANQGSNTLAALRVGRDGMLTAAGDGMPVPAPTSVVFAGRLAPGRSRRVRSGRALLRGWRQTRSG